MNKKIIISTIIFSLLNAISHCMDKEISIIIDTKNPISPAMWYNTHYKKLPEADKPLIKTILTTIYTKIKNDPTTDKETRKHIGNYTATIIPDEISIHTFIAYMQLCNSLAHYTSGKYSFAVETPTLEQIDANCQECLQLIQTHK